MNIQTHALKLRCADCGARVQLTTEGIPHQCSETLQRWLQEELAMAAIDHALTQAAAVSRAKKGVAHG